MAKLVTTYRFLGQPTDKQKHLVMTVQAHSWTKTPAFSAQEVVFLPDLLNRKSHISSRSLEQTTQMELESCANSGIEIKNILKRNQLRSQRN